MREELGIKHDTEETRRSIPSKHDTKTITRNWRRAGNGEMHKGKWCILQSLQYSRKLWRYPSDELSGSCARGRDVHLIVRCDLSTRYDFKLAPQTPNFLNHLRAINDLIFKFLPERLYQGLHSPAEEEDLSPRTAPGSVIDRSAGA
jgi:hypothetical protein